MSREECRAFDTDQHGNTASSYHSFYLHSTVSRLSLLLLLLLAHNYTINSLTTDLRRNASSKLFSTNTHINVFCSWPVLTVTDHLADTLNNSCCRSSHWTQARVWADQLMGVVAKNWMIWWRCSSMKGVVYLPEVWSESGASTNLVGGRTAAVGQSASLSLACVYRHSSLDNLVSSQRRWCWYMRVDCKQGRGGGNTQLAVLRERITR